MTASLPRARRQQILHGQHKTKGFRALRNSLITFPGNDASHMGAVAKVVQGVLVRHRRSVWPTSISHKIITTKDLEARANTTTQLSYIESVDNHKMYPSRSYSRVSVFDAAVDDGNSGPCAEDTVSVQLLNSCDAMDRVVRRGSIVAERLALDRIQDPDARRLIDRSYGGGVAAAGVVERRPERFRSTVMVALDAHAGEQVRIELLDDPEPGGGGHLVEEPGALGAGLKLHDVPPRYGGAGRRGGLIEIAARGEVYSPGAARCAEQGQEGLCRAHFHGLGLGTAVKVGGDAISSGGAEMANIYKVAVATTAHIAHHAVWVPSGPFLVSDGGIACQMSLDKFCRIEPYRSLNTHRGPLSTASGLPFPAP